MSKTVHIFKHSHNHGSCFLGKVLEEQGFKMRSFGVPILDFDEYDPLEADLLLIMGSPTGIYQAELFPFIDREIDAIQKRVAANKAILGICFGSQLIAKALGGGVYPGSSGEEIGWNPLILTDAGKDSPARHLCGSKTNMFHWHGDTFDLPEGATLLATSDKYRQIYSYGDNVVGLQCHAEIRRQRLKEWYVSSVKDITGENPAVHISDLQKQSEEYVDALNAQVRLFLTEWLEGAGLLA